MSYIHILVNNNNMNISRRMQLFNQITKCETVSVDYYLHNTADIPLIETLLKQNTVLFAGRGNFDDIYDDYGTLFHYFK